MKSLSTPEVSIIIPVYNAGKTIKVCVKSLLRQTFSNFEMLFINDGSKDNTLEVLQEIEKTDDRIKVFGKSNGGASSARNFGMRHAEGKYITFVDADDYIDDDFIERLINEKSSLPIGGIKFHKGNDEISYSSVAGEYNGKQAVLDLLNKYFDSTLLSSCWAKLIRTDLIRKYNFYFDEGLNSGEDQIFMLQYFMLKEIESVTLISDSSYHYMMDESNSLSKRNVPLTTSVKAMKYLNSLLPSNMAPLKRKLMRSHVYNVRKSGLSAIRKFNFRDICYLLRPSVSITIIKGIKSCF